MSANMDGANFFWFSDVAWFATVPELWAEHSLLASVQGTLPTT
jgi:hypothetical protein